MHITTIFPVFHPLKHKYVLWWGKAGNYFVKEEIHCISKENMKSPWQTISVMITTFYVGKSRNYFMKEEIHCIRKENMKSPWQTIVL
jgi:hypothetical protein